MRDAFLLEVAGYGRVHGPCSGRLMFTGIRFPWVGSLATSARFPPGDSVFPLLVLARWFPCVGKDALAFSLPPWTPRGCGKLVET